MTQYLNAVFTAVDLSRLDNDPYAEVALRQLLSIGKEVDLLEAMRRKKDERLTVDMVVLYTSGLQIDTSLVDVFLSRYQSYKMIDIDDQNVSLKFTSTREVLQYGEQRIEKSATEAELKLTELLFNCSKKAIPIEEFDRVLELFKKEYRNGLKNFILKNNLLTTFSNNGIDYVVSPRIYKDEKKFKEAQEMLEDYKLDGIVQYIQDNPANPLPVVQEHLRTEALNLELLTQSGILDPIRLDVRGDVKDYLYAPDVLNRREDKDHFDLVRKTLANFRYGEYYSKGRQLYALKRFLEYMLDHGYAGRAPPIGTDYQNLETAGVFRIEKINPVDFRFWMLKRDVVEDTLSILKGEVPIRSSNKTGDLTNIEGIVHSRSRKKMVIDPVSKAKIVEALRQIQDGLT